MEKLVSAIIGGLVIGLLYGSAVLWFYAITRWLRGEEIVPLEPRRPVPWGLVDLLLIFLIVLFTVPLAQQLARSWWSIPPIDDPAFTPRHFATLMLTSSLATLGCCFAAMALVQFRAGATLRDLGFVAAELWRDVKLGATAFVLLAPPMYLLQIGLTQIWKYEHPVQDLLEKQPDLTMLGVTLVTAVGVAPLAEEVFFRVLLQGWLENMSVLVRKSFGVATGRGAADGDELQRDWHAVMMGDRTGEVLLKSPPPSASITAEELDKCVAPVFRPSHVPIVMSAAIFALLHLGQGPAPIPLFFLAIGLGYLYRQTHRATPSIVVHLLINSVSMAALWIGLVFKP